MKSASLKLLLFSVCAAFLNMWLIYGFAVLNPAYDTWLLSRDGYDPVQHYLGWLFYRQSSWHFPLGLIDNLVYPDLVSIIYTDSIPIFALFFKLFSPILPETFQYFGIWAVLCLFLTCFLSSLIIYRLTKNFYYSIICSIFFLLMPTIYQRMFGHTALAGQWILLLGIYICIVKSDFTRIKLRIFWSISFCIAVSIHMYFAAMLGILLVAYTLSKYLGDKKIILAIFDLIMPFIAGIFTMYLLGAFYLVGNISANDYGIHSANLLSLINGAYINDFTKFNFLKFNVPEAQICESFAYIGAGMIVLCIISFVFFIKLILQKKISVKKDYVVIILMFIATFMFAISNIVYFGDLNLFTIPLNEKILNFFSIFRASGRFIWIINFSLFVVVFYFIFKNIRFKYVLIIICLALQIYDLQIFYKKFKIDQKIEYKNVFLENLPRNKRIILCDNPTLTTTEEHLKFFYGLFGLTYYVYKNHTNINDFYVARKNYNKINDYKNIILTKLNNSIVDEHIIYAFSSDMYKKYKNILKFQNINGFMLGWKE